MGGYSTLLPVCIVLSRASYLLGLWGGRAGLADIMDGWGHSFNTDMETMELNEHEFKIFSGIRDSSKSVGVWRNGGGARGDGGEMRIRGYPSRDGGREARVLWDVWIR